MTLFRTALGDAIRDIRIEKNMTLRDVSAKSAVALGYISEVERAQKEVSSELLAGLAFALDVPLHELITLTAYKIAESDGYITPEQFERISTKV